MPDFSPGNRFAVRELSSTDYTDVCGIYMKTFPCVDDADFIDSWLTRTHQFSLALLDRTRLREKSQLIGFGIVSPYNHNDFPNISEKLWFLAVDSSVRGGGAGSFLLDAIIEATLQHKGLNGLCLAPVNEDRIIHWYEKKGFQIIQRLPFIHEDIPTCLMALDDTSETITLSTVSSRRSSDSEGSL